MKPAISITTTILGCVLAAGLASAQSPTIIQKTQDKMNTASGKATAASSTKPTAAKSTGVAVAAAPAKPSSTTAKNTGAAKQVPAVAATPSAQPKQVPAVAAKSSVQPKQVPAVAAKPSVQPKQVSAVTAKPSVQPKQVPAVAAKPGAQPQPKPAVKAPRVNPPAATAAASKGATGGGQGEAAPTQEQAVLTSKNSANGRRDPFISPVVSHAGGSGCSTGKKCLEIGAINLRGVVHAESGFIAVVCNSLNKAYFLRENDPVFNGYVVKITGDSIVFQETVQDRLGKTFTREVVKKITTPAV